MTALIVSAAIVGGFMLLAVAAWGMLREDDSIRVTTYDDVQWSHVGPAPTTPGVIYEWKWEPNDVDADRQLRGYAHAIARYRGHRVHDAIEAMGAEFDSIEFGWRRSKGLRMTRRDGSEFIAPSAIIISEPIQRTADQLQRKESHRRWKEAMFVHHYGRDPRR